MRIPQKLFLSARNGIASLAVLTASSTFAVMAQNAPAAPAGSAPSPVVSLDAPATIQAFFATDLFAKESGYALRVDADIGDHVVVGQVLATIDNPELKMQTARAQAAVQQAEAALDVAKRKLAGLRADLNLQQVTLKRQEQLFAGKALTDQQLDEQRAKESVANAALDVGRADIALAEANLLAATNELGRMNALLEYTKIVAPFDGVVTRRFINPGDLVQAAIANRPATPLFTCQKIDVVRVFAEVPEATATLIRQGVPAEVRLYGPAAQIISGTVTRVASALDPATRTMRVEIDLPNPDERLLPGMYTQVSFRPLPPARASERRSSAADGG